MHWRWIAGALVAWSTAHAEPPERWVGTHQVHGERHLPIRGRVTTRTTTWVLADVVREGGRLRIAERPCRVDFAKVAGAAVRFDEQALGRMPLNEWAFDTPVEDGDPLLSTFSFGWDDSDVDEDGHPGATVYLRTPVCLGRVYLESWNSGSASATLAGGVLAGSIDVTVDQKVLGVGGFCFRPFIQDAVEHMAGVFEYVRVDAEATCDSLGDDAWPEPPEPVE